jgi:hypothetical protein
MGARWTAKRAVEWSASAGWVRGFNYVPSTAVNTTEFWQAETFDEATIAREMAWAADVGYNSCRVFVQYLVWEADPAGSLARLRRLMDIAGANGISTMLTLFDDCAFSGKQPYLGAQDAPTPGIHNSGWTPSPGHERVVDRDAWPSLEEYVTTVVAEFRDDTRVIAWDLYNEPGNSGMGSKSDALVAAAFEWARAANPTQPMTVGVWTPELPDLNALALRESDVVSFHNYGDVASMQAQIDELAQLGRPLLCTEWMRRPISLFASHLPVLKEHGVGGYAWGLVNGKTQTHFPWGSPEGADEPAVWFHDLLRTDGSSYDAEEVAFVRRTQRGDA